MNPLARIIDANANRAREALRVLEDVARFGLDDAGLCERLKQLRHDLRAAIDGLAGVDRGLLLANRDTPGDVGAAISTPAELSRAGLRDIAAANASRLTEALRSLEEAAKGLGGDGRGFEAMRYRAYAVEQDLLLALGGSTPRQWRLCILLTVSLCRHHDWLDVAAAAIAGGADCLQLREKEMEGRELLSRATALVALARRHGVSAIINDRPDIALLSDADGVHVGQKDLGVRDVRRLAGFRLVVGVSTSNPEEAKAAVAAGADYCGVGPMFPTSTKHKPAISGPAYLRQYVSDPVLSQRPHLAIGGITPDNAGELAAAGARGIAVSSAVCGSPDPEGVCRRLAAAIPAVSRPLPERPNIAGRG